MRYVQEKIRDAKINKAQNALVFAKIYSDAYEAGQKAAAECKPVAMIVQGGGQRYYVADGVCGFAWVTVTPGNSAFANWLKATGNGSKGYPSGVMIWIGDYDQSMSRKEAHAQAMANSLRNAGIKAYSGSRMD